MNCGRKLSSGPLCRTCLTNKNKLKDIFKNSIHKLVTSCTSIQISKDDGLSNMICSKCIRLIIRFYNFKLECQKSDKILKNQKASSAFEAEKKNSFKNEDSKENIDIIDFNDIIKTEIDDSNDYFDSIFNSPLPSIPEPDSNANNDNANVASDIDADETKPIKEELLEENDKPLASRAENKTKVRYRYSSRTAKNKSRRVIYEGNVKKFECEVCNLKVDNQNILIRHKETHEEDTSRTHVCHICFNAFTNERYLKKHIRRHDPKKLLKCEKCGKCFKNNHTLIAHLEKTHQDLERIKCSSCDMTFVLHSQLDRHRLMKHKEEAQRHVCAQCGRVFKSRCFLKTHELRHEKGNRPFTCPLCNKHFASKYTLKYHQRCHGKDSSSSTLCPLCGKSIANLSNHMITHSDKKPFKCDQCNKTFKTKSMMNSHRMRHTDIRRFGCNVCFMRFKDNRTLKLHSLIHTGEKPHQCTLCGKRFRQRGVLVTHMKVHNLH